MMSKNLKESQKDGLLHLHLQGLIGVIDGVKTMNIWLSQVKI